MGDAGGGGGWGGSSFPEGRRTHAGERPESTVAIELGSRLARSIVWVICRISGKMKALATVLRAPAVVSLIAADAGGSGGGRGRGGGRESEVFQMLSGVTC